MKKSGFFESQKRWQQLLAEQSASGQSVAIFCKERNLAQQTFYNWKSRLRSQTPKRSRLAKIEVVEPVGLKLEFDDGLILAFSTLPDVDWLRKLCKRVAA